MLNHAETTSIRTTVPGPPPLQDQSQQHLPDSLTSLLSALLMHPEFVQGVYDCQDVFFDCFEQAPLTEQEMIEEVEGNLSRVMTERDQQWTLVTGVQAPSYVHKLGWVIGTIAKGLTYA
jgi:hypothetical protein